MDFHNGISNVNDSSYRIITSEISGSHPRLERISNLGEVIESVQPDSIILEFDVATFMTFQSIYYSRKLNSKISFIALENFNRSFLSEAFLSFINFKFKTTAGAIITHILLKLNKNFIHKVYCVSSDGINAMKYLALKEEKIVKIPLGIDTRIFYPYSSDKTFNLRKKLGLKKITIAYFGRIIPEKGLIDLLTALGDLKKYEWQLLVDDLQHTELTYLSKLNQKIGDLGLKGRIVFFNAKHSEMPDYINCSDIVVLPSILTEKFKEQYGRVVAEAICCGKIVLVSNTGALPEVVGDVGFTFEGGNTIDMAEKLKYILENFNFINESSHDKIIERGKTNLSSMKQAEIFYNNL